MAVISFGIGKDYLPNWTVNEALREIFQNYLDYGAYTIDTVDVGKKQRITISNDYTPVSLEFLRIGNSKKPEGSIGKWGEGLKMAFLVFLRNKIEISILTDKWIIKPVWIKNKEIGTVLGISYVEHKLKLQKQFVTKLLLDKQTFETYVASIIQPEDILYTDSYHGDIVRREKGNIYCGRLFVCNVDNLTKSYNLSPNVLPLDRDRVLPKTWDVNYHTSKLNEKYQRWSTKDMSYSDTLYISRIPTEHIRRFRPASISGNIEVRVKHEDGTEEIVKNESIKEAVKQTSYFKEKVQQLIKYINRRKSEKERFVDFAERIKHKLTKEEYETLMSFKPTA